MTPEERIEGDRAVLTLLGIDVDSQRLQAGSVFGPDEDFYLSLSVTDVMVNAKGVCHGGILFAFADTVAAYALGDAGLAPVTVDANITYLRPALSGERIDARMRVLKTGRRNGVCSVSLVNAVRQTLAEYRATCANLVS